MAGIGIDQFSLRCSADSYGPGRTIRQSRLRPNAARTVVRAAIVLILTHGASFALAQSAPVSPDRAWHGLGEAAVLLGAVVLYYANHSPRTDDAEVFANFIGIAPQVEGPIVRLNVRDNQFVKKSELLYEIDERPYQYALEGALSEQAALEGQIADEQRRINALVSGSPLPKRMLKR